MKYNIGDKFVIEIGERFVGSNYQIDLTTGDIKEKDELFRAKNYNTLVFDENGLDKLDRLNDDYINEHYGMFQDAAYQKGMEDAWEAARKICETTVQGGYRIIELKEMFGSNLVTDITGNYTASEALEKIREFEEKQETEKEIKIGDEISYQYAGENTKGVVVQCIHIDEGGYKVICKNGCGQIINNKGTYHIKKTGRHFPQIAEVLEQMKEADNGN